MRKVTFVRWGVMAALAAVGSAGALAVGCSGDDNTTTTTDGGAKDGTTTDTGPKADTGTTDTGSGDSGGDAADAGPAKIVKLVLAHAAPDLGPFRLCFGTAKPGGAPVVTPLSPLPDAPTAAQTAAGAPPGIYPGTGGPLPTFPIDVTSIDITPFLLFAQDPKVASQISTTTGEATCAEMIGTDGQGGTGAKGLTKNTDYLQLATVPAQSFALGNTYLLALTGCLPTGPDDFAHDNTANTARCGLDWAASTGNVRVGIATLDTTTAPPDGGLNISFAHRSTSLEGNLGGSPGFGGSGFIPGIIAPAPTPDAGPPVDAGPDADAGDLDAAVDASDAGPPAPSFVVLPLSAAPIKFSKDKIAPTPPAAAPGLNLDHTPIGIFIPNADGGALNPAPFPNGNLVFALPLNVIQLLTTGAAPASIDGGTGPSMFVNGENYTFVILGDPNAKQLNSPDGGYDGHGLHFIAFPNHLAVPTL